MIQWLKINLTMVSPPLLSNYYWQSNSTLARAQTLTSTMIISTNANYFWPDLRILYYAMLTWQISVTIDGKKHTSCFVSFQYTWRHERFSFELRCTREQSFCRHVPAINLGWRQWRKRDQIETYLLTGRRVTRTSEDNTPHTLDLFIRRAAACYCAGTGIFHSAGRHKRLSCDTE